MFERHWFKRPAVAAVGLAGAFLVAQGTAVSGQGNEQGFKPHPSTQETSRLVTLDKLKQWEKELS